MVAQGAPLYARELQLVDAIRIQLGHVEGVEPAASVPPAAGDAGAVYLELRWFCEGVRNEHFS